MSEELKKYRDLIPYSFGKLEILEEIIKEGEK